MKKFLYGFIFAQIFFLLGGSNQIFATFNAASPLQNQGTEIVDFAAFLNKVKVSQKSPIRDNGNAFFDFGFWEIEEEENNKSISSKDFVDAANCIALLLWAKSFWAPQLAKQTNLSSHTVCGSISTPYYLILQTFRI